MEEYDLSYRRGVIRPIKCLRASWQLIKDDYWLWVAMVFVGMLLSSVAHLFLNGPFCCGLYLCLLRHMRGRPFQFADMFQGFNYFLPSFLATVYLTIPVLVLAPVFYACYFAPILLIIPAQPGDQPDGVRVALMFALQAVAVVGFVAINAVLGVLTAFVYPLIVDRDLPAWSAIRLSCAAVVANLGGVLGVAVLEILLLCASFLLCCFGAALVFPLTFATITVAYGAIFPDSRRAARRWADEDDDEDRDDDRHERDRDPDDEPPPSAQPQPAEGVREGLPSPATRPDDSLHEGLPR